MNKKELAPGLWHLEEDYRVYCTLLQGRDLAILWDTGQGKTDLAACLAETISTPCLVLNSHGHSDHIGGNFRFPRVYAHPADWWLLEAHARLTGRPWSALPLEPGQVFDLGERRARVVSLAGHTRGSVGLLLEEEGLLLAGDALNPTLLLLGPEAAPLSRLRQTLEGAAALPFDRYLSSHSPNPIPKAQVELHLAHLDHLRAQPPSRPGPYGPRVCRSQHKQGRGRSVILVDQGLLPQKQNSGYSAWSTHWNSFQSLRFFDRSGCDLSGTLRFKPIKQRGLHPGHHGKPIQGALA